MIDIERDRKLPFLDVLVNKEDGIKFTLFRKKTFTGLSINFFSFCPLLFKINAFKTLLYRSYNICSDFHLIHNEIDFLQKLFVNNSFPLKLLQSITRKFLQKHIDPPVPITTVPKKLIYFSLPYFGHKSDLMKKELQSFLSNCYPAINFRIILSNNSSIGNFFSFKDKIDSLLCPHVVYQYKCPHCKSGHYVGSTSRSLYIRSCEHRGVSYRTKRYIKSSFSAIRNHLESIHGQQPLEKDFNILRKVQDQTTLRIVESIYIKKLKPSLNNTLSAYPLCIAWLLSSVLSCLIYFRLFYLNILSVMFKYYIHISFTCLSVNTFKSCVKSFICTLLMYVICDWKCRKYSRRNVSHCKIVLEQ